MSKMKALLEDITEREEEIFAALDAAKEDRPDFYEMVSEFPSLKTVRSLLRGITDDEAIILLATGYLSYLNKS